MGDEASVFNAAVDEWGDGASDRLDDHSRMGSCTRSFTATMILQAVDRGHAR